MKEYKKDTAKEYDDLVGFVAEENIENTLADFLGETQEYKPQVKPKPVNSDFPEEWQRLIVNFDSLENYNKFMNTIGYIADLKVKTLVFEKNQTTNILDFLE